MKVLFYFAKKFDREYFNDAINKLDPNHEHSIDFIEPALTDSTVTLAQGYDAVCLFVNDRGTRENILKLASYGIKLILLRSAGFNHVDLAACEEKGIKVLRVPAYSPEAVAEHAVGLAMTLNRKFHKAYLRTRDHNFSLDGLLGFTFHGKTVGIIGTGKIGECCARIFKGFGCNVIANDVYEADSIKAMGIPYVSLDELCSKSDIISIHAPLLPSTKHLINAAAISKCKRGVYLINTSRGPLIDTRAALDGLRSGQIGALGLDVVEGEEGLFFNDVSDDVNMGGSAGELISLLLAMPNVVVTAHQAFFARESLEVISQTTISNLIDFSKGQLNQSRVVTLSMNK